ncbi:conserved Plasmodium protein, unknown function [Plasmodium ovale curtisi]|uniref:Uncharacterized protein n=1 Tax=Plasmodium ovale curtisi TaxID=864141 RepID=A0A1A8VN12_PLAOA|nr:conserved Plasmodium protein, unknown function [Plasmodium ovale curtisi]
MTNSVLEGEKKKKGFCRNCCGKLFSALKGPSITHSILFGICGGMFYYGTYYFYRFIKITYFDTMHVSNESRRRFLEKQMLFYNDMGYNLSMKQSVQVLRPSCFKTAFSTTVMEKRKIGNNVLMTNIDYNFVKALWNGAFTLRLVRMKGRLSSNLCKYYDPVALRLPFQPLHETLSFEHDRTGNEANISVPYHMCTCHWVRIKRERGICEKAARL